MPGIIVGTDGSAHSQTAVEWGMREAATRQVPVTVVIVFQAAVGYWGGKPSYPQGDELARKARAIAQGTSRDQRRGPWSCLFSELRLYGAGRALASIGA
jgi:nucleotide-binding universal stress UspA family protein